MKKYKAISETEFLRIVDILPTEEEIKVLNEGTEEEKKELFNDLSIRFADEKIEGDELAEVETVYNSFKPELNAEDVYELISFDVALRDGVEGLKLGSYNYKLNGKIINVIIR